MAGQPEIEVAFQAGPASLTGARARLPSPTRGLPPAEVARLRGAADAVALRLKHHDNTVHSARSPASREARDVYDALEQARVETLGSRHMAGVAANLQQKLVEQCEADGYDRMTRKEQLPLGAALSLIARERMSGVASPAATERVLSQWRATIGAEAEAALAEMARTTDDQQAFTRGRAQAALGLRPSPRPKRRRSRTTNPRAAMRRRSRARSRTAPRKARASPRPRRRRA